MSKKEALKEIEVELKAAREALKRAAKIADKNGVTFSFSLPSWGSSVPYYPKVTESMQARHEELEGKENRTAAETKEYYALDDAIGGPFEDEDDYGWWMPSNCW